VGLEVGQDGGIALDRVDGGEADEHGSNSALVSS
jgi:hypothetical protein